MSKCIQNFVKESIIPVNKSIAFKCIKMFKADDALKIPACWKVLGRNLHLSKEEVSQFVRDMKMNNKNRSVTTDNVKTK